MIDGAHVLTPGVLRYGMLGLSAYAPAVVTAKQWYVGPGPAARDGGGRLRPASSRIASSTQIELAHRRLPAVRDRPLHRRPRLVRRRVGEQLHLRPARPGRAGGRHGRELLDAGRRLRQPRLLRADGRPRRGSTWSPSSARGRSTRFTAGRPPTSPSPVELIRVLRGRSTRSCADAASSVPPQQAHYVGSLPPGRPPHQAAAHEQLPALPGRPPRGARQAGRRGRCRSPRT